jgi:hypothetical protein
MDHQSTLNQHAFPIRKRVSRLSHANMHLPFQIPIAILGEVCKYNKNLFFSSSVFMIKLHGLLQYRNTFEIIDNW